MNWKSIVFIGLAVLSNTSATEQATWVVREGTVYGARPDEQGPIGGGKGYAHIVKQGDHTVQTLDGLLVALDKAQPGEVVFIPGEVTLDLTSRIYIEDLELKVPAGVTLASDRGRDGSKGALLCSDALKTPVLIRVTGPDARITGLRLRGPNPKRCMGHYRRSFAQNGKGRDYYYKFPTQDGIYTDQDNLEVDNCEISGFGHSGIFLRAGAGHHIHHNHIHHCQYHGLGYGVSHDRATSLIEYNLFNWNRHSIAGTGRPGCGYVARHNIDRGNALSHSFDMHGGRDRKDGTHIAGTSVQIVNNTLYTSGTAINIRGTPQQPSAIKRNWFVQRQGRRNTVFTNGNVVVEDNVFGPEAALRPKTSE